MAIREPQSNIFPAVKTVSVGERVKVGRKKKPARKINELRAQSANKTEDETVGTKRAEPFKGLAFPADRNRFSNNDEFYVINRFFFFFL